MKTEKNEKSTANNKKIASVSIFFITLSLAAGISQFVFRNHTVSQDEFLYLYQARIFAAGETSVPADESQRSLLSGFILWKDGRSFSKYPPGFSAVLALGVKAGVPGLINPLLSALSAVILFNLVSALVSLPAAIVALALMIVNSYFLGYASSFFSQPLMLFLAACTFYFIHAYGRRRRRLLIVMAGLFAAYGFLTRPLDAFCLVIAGLSALMAPKSEKSYSDIALFIATAFTGLLALFIFNYVMGGKFGLANYPIWNGEFKVINEGAANPFQNMVMTAKNYLFNLRRYTFNNFLRNFLPMIGPVLIFLSAAGFLFLRNGLKLSAAIFIFLLVLLYNFHGSLGWPQYGVRYWYPSLAVLVICSAAGLETIYKRFHFPALAAILIAGLILQSCRLAEDLETYHRRFTLVEAIQKDIEQACPAKSIVVMNPFRRKHPEWPKFVNLFDFKRNPFLNGERLYVNDPEEASKAAPHYPDYQICSYTAEERQNIMNLAQSLHHGNER